MLDPSSTLSYVTFYVAIHFTFHPECISDPFYVSLPMGDSMVARNVHRGCVVSIHCRKTLVDIIELYMLDFYVI